MTMTVTVVSRAKRRKSAGYMMSSWILMLMSPPCSVGHEYTVFQVKERQTIFPGLPLAYPLGLTSEDLLAQVNVGYSPAEFEGYLT